MSFPDLAPLLLTLRLATVTTLTLLVFGTPLAWWLARTRCSVRPVIEALVALPLVLPPTVLGFYLLVALSPQGPVGSFVQSLGGPTLAFSFTGLVIGSVIYSLPFVVQPLQNAFAGIAPRTLEAAATLGANPADRFLSIVLPQAKTGFLAAVTLGFAHTVGEFGVVLMIGGNIPGTTQVLSITIYDQVESLQYPTAHLWSALLLGFSFIVLLVMYGLRGGQHAQVGK